MNSLATLRRELEAIGRRVAGWRAQLNLLYCAAGLLLALAVFALADYLSQYGAVGRWVLGVLIWTAAGATAWWVQRLRNRRTTPQAVAARIEKAFPQLDNHLINYLQFASAPETSPFTAAYVERGLPEWGEVKVDAMRDRKADQLARRILGGAALLLLIPLLFLGRSWAVAIVRVAFPFADVPPVTLTHLLKVEPGDATVLQGAPAVLSCTVQGEPGHRVWVDVAPSDQEPTTYALGELAGGKEETLSHRLAKVNGEVRYRFRAGDATVPAWNVLKTRPPLAFRSVRATVVPPDYMKAAPRTTDGLSADLPVPAGSVVAVQAAFNLPVRRVVLRRGTNEHPLAAAGGTNLWQGRLTIDNGLPVALIAEGESGDRAEQALRIAFEPDRPPSIAVLSPEGRPMLGAGQQPEIVFQTSDDFGLSEIVMEEVVPGSERDTEGTVLQTWKPDGRKEQNLTWRDTRVTAEDRKVRAYRITAVDNGPGAGPERKARSANIIFNQPSADELAKQRDALEKEASSLLAKVIALQRQNIEQTRLLAPQASAPASKPWHDLAGRQEEIRTLTRQLLGNPLNPLGRMAGAVQKVYLNEMANVIPLLAGVPDTELAQRPPRIANAQNMEDKILRQLCLSDGAAADAKVDRRVTALSSMLADMIKRQSGLIKETEACVEHKTQPGKAMVDGQDDLAADITEFMQVCRSDSAAVIGTDAPFAALLVGIADLCAQLKVREDMTLAGGKLDDKKPAEALPHEQESVRKLKELYAKLDEIRAQDEQSEEAEMLAAVAEARARIEKLAEVQRKLLEAMEQVADQKDKSNKDTDMLEEEYEELQKNLEEALLQVPTDLNVFMELNVANDIVEDVFTVFEEIQQAEGSENLTAGDVKERALAKREEYLEGMEEAKDRLDDLEKWLSDKPDDMKITAEAFDREEMPAAGIALGALATEADNLIGDLLKKDEEMSKEADDGAINTSVPDMVASAEVKEGDVTSFAAQGASGNETPDHKEQDGRSNVGRQGMAVGETAAGSGRIDKGDENIEARRTQEPTQSGQVDVEGDDVDTKATGGGKQGTGKADAFGMEGGVKRMDSTEEGSGEGQDALMAKRADAMYAKASTQNIRVDSLKTAAHHLRQADDAIAKGDIAQLREHRKVAMLSIQKAKAQIDAELAGSFNIERKPSVVEGVVEGGPDAAPAQYRDLVSEYYKALNETL